MNKNCDKYKDYIFVGNTITGGDLSELKGLDYLVGDVAYDIKGIELDKNYMRPLFIGKKDYKRYDMIMMDQLKAIRMGFKI